MECLFLLGEMEKIKSPKKQYDAVNGTETDKNESSLSTEQCTDDNIVMDDVSFPSEEGTDSPPMYHHHGEVKSNIGLLPLTVLVFYK